MLTIKTTINYTGVKTTPRADKRTSLYEKRAKRKKQGLCQACGGPRPCVPCGARSRAWKAARRIEARKGKP